MRAHWAAAVCRRAWRILNVRIFAAAATADDDTDKMDKADWLACAVCRQVSTRLAQP